MVVARPGRDHAGMPRTLSFPPPARDVCPDCDGPVSAARCRACGLDLEHADAGSLWWLDLELHRLAAQRAVVLDRVRRATRAPGAPVPGPTPAAAPAAPAAPAAGGGIRLQHLLLGLGSFCLVVAAVVFAAVTWDRLGAVAQGAILLGFTAVAGAGAATCRSRGLRSTAEALASVAVALSVADVHAARVGLFPDLDTAVIWAAGLSVVALAAWAYSRAVPLATTRLAALATGCLPGLILAVRWTDEAAVPAGVLLAQAAGLVAWLRFARARRVDEWFRACAAVGAVGQWGLATLIAFDEALVMSDFGAGPALVLPAAASVAVAVALAWPDRDEVRVLGTGVGTGLALLAAGITAATMTTGDEPWLVTAALAVLVAAAGHLLPSRWGAVPAVVASAVALLATTPASEAVLTATLGPLGLPADPWRAGLDEPARQVLSGVLWTGSATTAAFLVVPWALLGVWARRLDRWAVAAAAVVLTAVTAAVLPLAFGGSVGLAVGVLLGGAVGAVTWVSLDQRAAPAAYALGGWCSLLALAWASVSEPGTLVVLAVVLLTAATTTAVSVHRGDRAGAVGCVALAIGSASVLAVVGALTAGRPVGTAWWCLAAFAAMASAGGWAAERRSGQAHGRLGREGWSVMAATVDGLTAAGFGIALLALTALEETDVLSVAMLLGVATLAAHALRPTRRPAVWAATTMALSLTWLRLVVADVHLVEAYSLPAAVALLAAGWFRSHRAGSWVTAGPGLAVAAAPSVLAMLADPGLVRPLTLAAAGAAVVLAGARERMQAPVVIGGLTVVAVGVHQLSPVVAAAPRYLTFAVLGCLLLAVGATFEQRRRDAAELWDRFEALR